MKILSPLGIAGFHLNEASYGRVSCLCYWFNRDSEGQLKVRRLDLVIHIRKLVLRLNVKPICKAPRKKLKKDRDSTELASKQFSREILNALLRFESVIRVQDRRFSKVSILTMHKKDCQAGASRSKDAKTIWGPLYAHTSETLQA